MKIKKPKLFFTLIFLGVSVFSLTLWMRSERLKSEEARMRNSVQEAVSQSLPEDLRK